MNKHAKLLALLLALVMVFSMTACGKKTEEAEPSESEGSDRYVNNLSEEEEEPGNFPTYIEQVQEKYEQNDHTVGWLEVPGTHINDVVVCNTAPDDNNNYYYRRNFEREYSWNGVFYADFRCKFGEGDKEDLASNTVIYGHTMSEDIDGVMFAPLKYFEQEDFAKETPYIYFSTLKEDLVWEVFSVFYGTVELPYNQPNPSSTDFEEIINECRKRSIYTYDTDVSADDKVLTLSTCVYSVPGIGKVSYPNNYRYAVMAKLVEKKNATKTEASFTVNPDPKAP